MDETGITLATPSQGTDKGGRGEEDGEQQDWVSVPWEGSEAGELS